MSLTPGYGETPLPEDELSALLDEVFEILDKPITRAAVYDLEQGFQDRVSDELMPAAIEGSLPLDELLNGAWCDLDVTGYIGQPSENWPTGGGTESGVTHGCSSRRVKA